MARKTRTHVVPMPIRYRVWCDTCDKHIAVNLKAGESETVSAEHITREHGGR